MNKVVVVVVVAGEGTDSVTNQAEVITPHQVEYLWKKGFWGSKMSKLLRNSTFYFGKLLCVASRAAGTHKSYNEEFSVIVTYR